MILFLAIVLPVCVAVAYIGNKGSARADVHRVLGRAMDGVVSKAGALVEPIIGVERRVSLIEWYGMKRGWETVEAHRMTKAQIDRSD